MVHTTRSPSGASQSNEACFHCSADSSFAFNVSVQIKADKLTSPETLTSVDYPNLASCWDDENEKLTPSSLWKRSMEALHRDAFWSDSTFDIKLGQDEYCRSRCIMTGPSASAVEAIDSYEYHFWLDDLPVALRIEDDERVSTNFWAGVPIGTVAEPTNERYASVNGGMILYNHYNFYIRYYQEGSKYRILETLVEPFSIATPNGQPNTNVASCVSDITNGEHTTFEMLQGVAPAVFGDDSNSLEQTVFTYDVIWQLVPGATTRDYKDRWSVFLTMDDAQSTLVKFVGVFVSAFILTILLATIWTWVNRDLSYKPVMLQVGSEYEENGMDEDLSPEAYEELRIWPLSTRLFFQPRNAPRLLCVACGTGVQILVTGLIFVVLFRLGIVSQSLWADLLTPIVVLYALAALPAGYVTGRMRGGLFHGTYNDSLSTCAVTALLYPLMGVIVVVFVYDILPPSGAPGYNASAQYLPMILVWIMAILPLMLIGGHFGYKHGPIQDFPVSEGSTGYQDLDLQNNNTGNHATAAQEVVQEKENRGLKNACYILCLLAIGGILPVLGVFVAYSYDVAGPVFVGFYVDNSSYMIASYSLFLACTGAVSILLFYKQIRVHKYDWWWPAFSTGGSSGLYLFILTMTWLVFNSSQEQVSGRVWMLYFIWFAYTSLGVACATGFCGVVSCMVFTSVLYKKTKQRGHEV